MFKVKSSSKDLIILENQSKISYFAENSIPHAIFKSSPTIDTFEMDLNTIQSDVIYSIIITDYDQAYKEEMANIDLNDVIIDIELPKEKQTIKLGDILKNGNGIQPYCNSVWLWDVHINNDKKKIHVEQVNKQFQLTSVDPSKILSLEYLQDGFDINKK